MSFSFVTSDQTVFAISSFDKLNDVEFYDPNAAGCISSPSNTNTNIPTSQTSNDNQSTVAKFLTSSKFSGNGDKLLNIVQVAAIMGNLEWESTGFNPKATSLTGKFNGLAQWSVDRWNNISNPKVDINNQLEYLKNELDGSYKDKLSELWSASSASDLNMATYSIARNYEVAITKDNTSTKWVNETDAASSIQNWTQRIDYAKSNYNKYINLASGSTSTSSSGCQGLVSGGMTLDQAKKFMDTYKNLKPSSWPAGGFGTQYHIFNAGCPFGPLANCVAFSQYFINSQTTKTINHLGDGKSVVDTLINNGFDDGGHTPKVYAIFSNPKVGAPEGHTGVVLGIDKDTIIIGEAACGYSMDSVVANPHPLSDYTNGDYTYAYTDKYLRSGSL